jgi:hypothetical protein
MGRLKGQRLLLAYIVQIDANPPGFKRPTEVLGKAQYTSDALRYYHFISFNRIIGALLMSGFSVTRTRYRMLSVLAREY